MSDPIIPAFGLPKTVEKAQGWAVRGLRLPAAKAIEEITASKDMPEEDKAWLISKINKSGFAGVVVDAYEQNHEGAIHMHSSINKLF